VEFNTYYALMSYIEYKTLYS